MLGKLAIAKFLLDTSRMFLLLSAWKFLVLYILRRYNVVINFSVNPLVGEGNGTPLQYSCLENPRDRGAWWAAVSGVVQSWTQLKWLSSSSSNPLVVSIVLPYCDFSLHSYTPHVGWKTWGILDIIPCVVSVCCVAGAQYVFILWTNECRQQKTSQWDRR